jgi:hypothetical protein
MFSLKVVKTCVRRGYVFLEAALFDLLETADENQPHEVHELVHAEEVELVPVLPQDDQRELEPLEEVLLAALDAGHLL